MPHFEQAFHEKADGLRILQYLRQKHREYPIRDEVALYDNLSLWMPNNLPEWYSKDTDFKNYTVKQLDHLRQMLLEVETKLRKK